MYRLLQLLHSYRAFLLLVFVEIVCFWMLVGNSPYHAAAYFHSSNALIGRFYEIKTNVDQYFSLPKINDGLANDNAQLRELLSKSQVPIIVSTVEDSLKKTKSLSGYKYLAARVINNSTSLSHNFLTINKGESSGVEAGMGVISANGIVGKVMSVSENFATVSSLLNTNVYVSVSLQGNQTFGSINWNGKNTGLAKLMFIPRHIQLQKGDSIVTSGYNAVFPEHILVGFIENFSLTEDASWYNIDVALSNDFSNLAYVYIVKNPNKGEILELESENLQEHE